VEKIKIVEKKQVAKEQVILIGFPEVGLVGTIAASHIIEALKLEEVGSVTSEYLPPVIVVHKRQPKTPVRIYGKEGITCIISEVPFPSSMMYPMSKAITDWLESKGAQLIMLLGGIAHPDRLEIKKPGIYGVASNANAEKILEENKIRFLEEGFISGINALILYGCAEKNIPSLYLLAEAHYGYPDPGAAASIVEAVSKIAKIEIETEALLEKEEEIRIAARDLMRSTEEAMRAAKKAQEQEMPVMYG